MPVHSASSEGFGAAAATYVAGRPGYPAEVDAWLRSVLRVGREAHALDLGSGSGKFLPHLLATGAHVTAVEPVAAMRAELASRFPLVEALSGDAEDVPLATARFDAVVCPQSFHWFASEAALAEIRRVLKPGGRLGLVWNVRDEREPWVSKLSAITDRHGGETPRFRSGAWRRLFPAEGFSLEDERMVSHAHVGDVEDVVLRRTLSVSFIAALPPEERAGVERQVRALINATPALRRRTVRFPYTTLMLAFRSSVGG